MLLVVIITFSVYYQALDNEFVNWDDNVYITNNSVVQSFSTDNIKKIFSESFEGHYHPLTLFSFAVDYHFFKSEAWFYHFINIILHLLNTLLVFVLIRKLFSRIEIAIITSLLFGIHPMQVEAVAWVTARKDVLYTLFFLLSLNTYLIYLRSSKIHIYLLSLFLFLLAVLSKGQAVSLSITLFAIDYLYKRNLLSRKVILEKTPFIVISLVFGIIVYFAQRDTGYSGETELLPFYERLAYACYGLFMYLNKLLLPLNLSAYYPYPQGIDSGVPYYVYLSIIVVIALLALLIYSFKRNKGLAFGIMFFVINIVLMLKLFPVANFIIADRYVYIPSIGIFVIIGILVSKLQLSYKRWQNTIALLFVVYFVFLGFLSFNRVEVWQNSSTLLDDILLKHSKVVTALNARGDVRAESGDLEAALSDFNRAIECSPGGSRAYRNRALLKYRLGDYSGSIVDYNTTLLIDTSDAISYLNRGLAKEKVEDMAGALSDYNATLKVDPGFAEAYNNRGSLRSIIGEHDKAMLDYNKAIELKPGFGSAYANRAKLYNKLGMFNKSLSDISTALTLGFTHPELYFEQGYALYNSREFHTAIESFTTCIQLQNDNSDAYLYRAYAKNILEDFHGAVSDLDIALKYDQTNAVAYAIRGIAKIKSGMKEQGCRDLHAAEKLGLEQASLEIDKYCED